MVQHIRIGDWQNDAGGFCAIARVEKVLQINDIGPAEGIGLGVHPVVGGHDDGRAHFVELSEIAIHHGVEVVGGRRSGRALVLDVIGSRQIHDIRPLARHELHAGREHEFRQRCAVHRWQWHANQR